MAIRNLHRSDELSLPSGQKLVDEITQQDAILTNELGIRKLTAAEVNADNVLDQLELDAQTPLWFYLLAEAFRLGRGRKLGPLGSYIVTDVLMGLIKLSPQFGSAPLPTPSGRPWTMSEMVHDILLLPDR